MPLTKQFLIRYSAKNFQTMRNVLRIYYYYYYHHHHHHHRVWRVLLSRHNSVCIMTGRAGRLRNRGSIPYSGKRFFLSKNQVPRLRMSGVMLHFPPCLCGMDRVNVTFVHFPCSKTLKTKFSREVRKLPSSHEQIWKVDVTVYDFT